MHVYCQSLFFSVGRALFVIYYVQISTTSPTSRPSFISRPPVHNGSPSVQLLERFFRHQSVWVQFWTRIKFSENRQMHSSSTYSLGLASETTVWWSLLIWGASKNATSRVPCLPFVRHIYLGFRLWPVPATTTPLCASKTAMSAQSLSL
jgi:hypothetical protein